MSRVIWPVLICAVIIGALYLMLGRELRSERSKRIELEGENERITSIMDRVVKSSMTTRHTIADCYFYQGEISLLISEYYGFPDSLPAVSPKASFSETNLIIRESLDWQAASDMLRKMLFEDSSEVKE